MSESIKNLKKAMNTTVFQEVTFSENQKKNIFSSIEKYDRKELELLILLIIEQSSKTGYGIFKELKERMGREDLLEEEGSLYIILHQLEQKKWIASTWIKDDSELTKHYYLEKKGKKHLALSKKETKKTTQVSPIFDLEGGLR